MPYLIEGHMGGIWESIDEPDYEELYCETCGDSDTILGWFDTEEERQELMRIEY